jgi:hypothetical protein
MKPTIAILMLLIMVASVMALDPILPITQKDGAQRAVDISEMRDYSAKYDSDKIEAAVSDQTRAALVLGREWQVGGATCSVGADYETSITATSSQHCITNNDVPGVSIHVIEYDKTKTAPPWDEEVALLDIEQGKTLCASTTPGWYYRFVVYECTAVGVSSCTDDDPTTNEFKAGTVRYSFDGGTVTTHTDQCDGDVLVQPYCDSNNEVLSKKTRCSSLGSYTCDPSRGVCDDSNTCDPDGDRRCNSNNWIVQYNTCGEPYQYLQNCGDVNGNCEDGRCVTQPEPDPEPDPFEDDLFNCISCQDGKNIVELIRARQATTFVDDLLGRQAEATTCETEGYYTSPDTECAYGQPVAQSKYFKPKIESMTVSKVVERFGNDQEYFLISNLGIDKPLPREITMDPSTSNAGEVKPGDLLKVTMVISNFGADPIDMNAKLAEFRAIPGGQEVIDVTINENWWEVFWGGAADFGSEFIKTLDFTKPNLDQKELSPSHKNLIDSAPWFNIGVVEIALYSEEAITKGYNQRRATTKQPDTLDTVRLIGSCQEGEYKQGFIASHAVLFTPPAPDGDCIVTGGLKGGACKVSVTAYIRVPVETTVLTDDSPNFAKDGKYFLTGVVADKCYEPEAPHTYLNLETWEFYVNDTREFEPAKNVVCCSGAFVRPYCELEEVTKSNLIGQSCPKFGAAVVKKTSCAGSCQLCQGVVCPIDTACDPNDGKCKSAFALDCTEDLPFKCENGVTITTHKCVNGKYESTGNVCKDADPTCFDGLLNQQEAKIDCGGPNCPPCEVKNPCKPDQCIAKGLFCKAISETEFTCENIPPKGDVCCKKYNGVVKADVFFIEEKQKCVGENSIAGAQDDCDNDPFSFYEYEFDKENYYCFAEPGKSDSCVKKKTPLELSNLGDTLETPLTKTEIEREFFLLNQDNAICRDDTQCQDNGECLLAVDSDDEKYELEAVIFEYLKESVFDRATGASEWFNWFIPGEQTSYSDKDIEQFGVCVFDDRTVGGTVKRWVARLFGWEEDDKKVIYVLYGGGILAVLILIYLYAPKRPRQYGGQ